MNILGAGGGNDCIPFMKHIPICHTLYTKQTFQMISEKWPKSTVIK